MHDITRLTRDALRVILDHETPPSLEFVAQKLGVSPLLLHGIPELRPFVGPQGIERFLDWTVRDWLNYHYLFVHQGYRYGRPELQMDWRGHRLIKNPLDCWVYQEIINRTRPDVLIELGVAFGGSAVFFADVMELIGHGEVLGIDISLERAQGVSHSRVTFWEGSSVDPGTIQRVREHCRGRKCMVFADSNHAETHVLQELRAYADLVGEGMYLIVEDSLADIMDTMPVPIAGPLPAIRTFLEEDPRFEQDLAVSERYLMTQSPYGFLVRRGVTA